MSQQLGKQVKQKKKREIYRDQEPAFGDRKARIFCFCGGQLRIRAIFHRIPPDFSSSLSSASRYAQKGSDKWKVFPLLCQISNHSFTERSQACLAHDECVVCFDLSKDF